MVARHSLFMKFLTTTTNLYISLRIQSNLFMPIRVARVISIGIQYSRRKSYIIISKRFQRLYPIIGIKNIGIKRFDCTYSFELSFPDTHLISHPNNSSKKKISLSCIPSHQFRSLGRC